MEQELPRTLFLFSQIQGREPPWTSPGTGHPGRAPQEEARAAASGGAGRLCWEPSIWKPSGQGRGELQGRSREGDMPPPGHTQAQPSGAWPWAHNCCLCSLARSPAPWRTRPALIRSHAPASSHALFPLAAFLPQWSLLLQGSVALPTAWWEPRFSSTGWICLLEWVGCGEQCPQGLLAWCLFGE